MPPRNRRLLAVGAALGAVLFLLVVALSSGTATAAVPATQASGQTITYTSVWHGKATSQPPRAPDVLVLPSPPAGQWWQITKIQLTGDFAVKKSFRQTNFLFVQNPNTYPGLADPNLDVLAHLGLNSGLTGSYIGAGGVGSSPNSSWDWTQFEQPICLNSEVQIVLGSSLGVGNSVTVLVDYQDLGAGTTVVEYGHPQLDGKSETFQLGPAPSGTKWYLQNAYASIQAAHSGGARTIAIKTSSGGSSLLAGTDFPAGVNVRDTGGYSTVQTGPALNQYGSQTVWTSPIWLSGSEYIIVTFTGGESSDNAMYALGFTQVAG
jgi:hypothetical protein